ncbi:MAG: H-NS histone family protein [Alphaproteobacteria bacterium]|nr:H-NS histone family protein [Alphaproteobacteria bacterium]
MASINLNKMSLKDLLALQEDLEQAIANAQLREKQEVLSQMEALAQERGFSMNELITPRGRGKGKGSVSAAKYANPDNRAETWTGRGRKPNWLVDKLKKGAKIDDFAI